MVALLTYLKNPRHAPVTMLAGPDQASRDLALRATLDCAPRPHYITRPDGLQSLQEALQRVSAAPDHQIIVTEADALLTAFLGPRIGTLAASVILTATERGPAGRQRWLTGKAVQTVECGRLNEHHLVAYACRHGLTEALAAQLVETCDADPARVLPALGLLSVFSSCTPRLIEALVPRVAGQVSFRKLMIDDAWSEPAICRVVARRMQDFASLAIESAGRPASRSDLARRAGVDAGVTNRFANLAASVSPVDWLARAAGAARAEQAARAGLPGVREYLAAVLGGIV